MYVATWKSQKNKKKKKPKAEMEPQMEMGKYRGEDSENRGENTGIKDTSQIYIKPQGRRLEKGSWMEI